MNGMKSCWAIHDSVQRELLKRISEDGSQRISKGPRKEPNTREIDQ